MNKKKNGKKALITFTSVKLCNRAKCSITRKKGAINQKYILKLSSFPNSIHEMRMKKKAITCQHSNRRSVGKKNSSKNFSGHLLKHSNEVQQLISSLNTHWSEMNQDIFLSKMNDPCIIQYHCVFRRDTCV